MHAFGAVQRHDAGENWKVRVLRQLTVWGEPFLRLITRTLAILWEVIIKNWRPVAERKGWDVLKRLLIVTIIAVSFWADRVWTNLSHVQLLSRSNASIPRSCRWRPIPMQTPIYNHPSPPFCVTGLHLTSMTHVSDILSWGIKHPCLSSVYVRPQLAFARVLYAAMTPWSYSGSQT